MEEFRPNEDINGRYVLKESKGRGTFGQVWLAYDRATDEDVAIKFYVALDDKGREEFIQEFRIAAKLRHNNLLITKDYGEWQGHPFLTMKYCGQGSAAKLIGAMNPDWHDEQTIWSFIHDVSAGLAYLHAVEPDPIVHQDIKPDNILIDTNGTFLITDFGISKQIRSTMRRQSTRVLKAGAPAYMGPERFSKNPEPILASDVWSLGASIYELAEGELPFCGMGGIMMVKGAEIPVLSAGWSKNLNDLMCWCLEKDTWNRAKAYQVREIAETVLKTKNDISVEKLISQIKENGAGIDSQPENPNYDPRATRQQVNGESKAKIDIEDEEPSMNESDVRTMYWWKKPVVWGIVTAGVLLAVIAILFVLSHSASQSETNPDIETGVDTVAVDVVHDVTNDSATTPATNIIAAEKQEHTPIETKPTVAVSKRIKTEQTVSKGQLDLGYATWVGNIRNGKPDGKGTMTFSASHRIDSRDSQKRMAEGGERIEGTYVNGHLDEGRWYKSDGTTEYIMLGE